MKTKLTGKFWATLIIFGLMGQIAWVVENMYFNVFIYKMFHASAGDISLMVAASAVAATLTTVFMGALSDRLGKRKAFIVIGYVLWGLSIFAFALLRKDRLEGAFGRAVDGAAIGIALTIILDCVMTFFGSTANDAAFNAWLTDSTDATNRGSAEGVNAMMPLMAVLVVFGGFMFFDLDRPESWVWIFSIIGTLTLIVGLLGLIIIKEPNIKPVKQPYFSTAFYGFRPSTMRRNPALYIGLAGFVLFNISIQVFMPYLILYYEISLRMSNYVLIMAPAIIIASAVTALWGKVYDKKGFRFSGLIAVAALAAGYVLLFIFRETALVFAGSLLMMSGYLSAMAVFGAVIRDETPKGKSGMFQGVRICGQVLIPGVVGPYIGKSILANADTIINPDGTTSFVPNKYIFLGALIVLALVLPFFFLIRERKVSKAENLATPYEKQEGEVPFSAYPRPRMKRKSYICLNGKWQLKITAPGGKTQWEGEILVPFAPESRMSGVGRSVGDEEVLIYERELNLPAGFNRGRLLLHIGAADQSAKVYVNDALAGEHIGGYLPFFFDITDIAVEGENRLRIEVCDPLNMELPYGKQSKKSKGMWYTKTSGIWKTVWLESVPEKYISDIKITATLTGIRMEVQGGDKEKRMIINTPAGDKVIDFTGDVLETEIQEPVLWSPENPHLYHFTLVSGEDEIESYFGLRTVECVNTDKGPAICLNGSPYFFNGLLDQGYYSDGIVSPGSPQGYEDDILRMKACGFNVLRKHCKVEPEIFYEACDRLGMIVFQDFVNSGKYHFFRDTALPFFGFKKLKERRPSAERKKYFLENAMGTAKLLYNHPCVCCYTIFNEGWGQFESTACYRLFKEKDPGRVFDTASGWFYPEVSDVDSYHVYLKKVKLKTGDRPLVLSEFGGYSLRIDGHIFNTNNNYGYGRVKDKESLESALARLYKNEIIPNVEQGLCCAVYTQVSDVEDETNGLLTYDRQVMKVDPRRIKKIMDEVYEAFAKRWEKNES
ncbi:MAG: MFS transporter [Lachnospiraceae bacterium]|jgi:MFS family permease